MANLRLAPRVTATKARRPRRRASRTGARDSHWAVDQVRVAVGAVSPAADDLPRRNGRSRLPSCVGLAILAIRALTRRVKSRRTGTPTGTQDGAQEPSSTEPATGNDTVASEAR